MTEKDGPENVLGDDVVFAITSGYYPQIAATLEYHKRRKGIHGSTGAKYMKIRGFSNASIEKAETFDLSDDEYDEDHPYKRGTQATRKRKKLWKSQQQDKNIRQLREGETKKGKSEFGHFGLKDDESGDRASLGVKTLKRVTYWDKKQSRQREHFKWIGGSENYRLYGDQIWYMHGVRGRNSNVLLDFVKNQGENASSAAFMDVYSKKEGQMVDRAIDLANKLFDTATKQAEAILDKEKVSEFAKGVMSQEEMGFKWDFGNGSFSYIPTEAALANEDIAKQLDQKTKDSWANVRDLVRVTWDKDGKPIVSRILDVTEMAITDPGQHGITEVPKALTDAIAKIGGNKDTESKEMGTLRMAVQKMFVKAIDKEYNPIIQDLKKTFKDKTGKRVTSFQQVVDQVKKETGKRVSVADIAQSASAKLGKAAYTDTLPKNYNETAMKYIVHMLATWGGKVGNDYTQAHRIHDYPDGSGQSIFGYTTMRQFVRGTKRMEFDPQAPKGKGTWLHVGYNATLAMEVAAGTMTWEQSRQISVAQKRNFMTGRVTNRATETVRGALVNTASKGIKDGVLTSTQCYIPTTAALGVILGEILKGATDVLNDSGENILTEMESRIPDNRYSYNAKTKNMNLKGKMDEPMFWALPYVGILQSEHIEGKKKKKK